MTGGNKMAANLEKSSDDQNMKQNLKSEESTELEAKFYCGVVEGFYGRPWTTSQRKTLFQRMQKFQMDTYLYAPKDDCKHRMYWRDLYSVEEADHLTGLIKEAAEHNVVFVYALSPGLDMTYSNTKEVMCLKRKLEQVASFGCTAFALLFDDIDVDMSEADKAIFQSFAQAQVSVTNEVYQHLNQPQRFLFCPTEYCSSRAVPSVEHSEYLNTIGSRLLPGIDIMWTGPKVISKKLTLEHIEEITKSLRRPPVIWDNIHANDYDQKRLFLGPYEGRSSALIPRLRGVMTNPNCEFEANFIAMHTLAQWARSYRGESSEAETLLSSSPVHSDIRLETQGDFGGSDEDLGLASSYRPKEALHGAIKEWLELFTEECNASISKVTSAKPAIITAPAHPTPSPNVAAVQSSAEAQVSESYMQPQSIAPVNSLLNDSDGDSGAETSTEPMETAAIPPVSVQEPLPAGYDSGCADCSVSEAEGTSETAKIEEVMQVDQLPVTIERSANCQKCSIVQSPMPSSINDITCEDLHLLVDLFYMPFEHGFRSSDLLTELVWLKLNCCYVTEAKLKNATEEQLSRSAEWNQRAENFKQQIAHVHLTFEKFLQMPNKAILKDLFSYIWDMKTILSLVETFVEWLAIGTVPAINLYYLQNNPCTWSNFKYQEAFQNGSQEPWVFRGGLQAEFQRLLPLDGAGDLLLPSLPPNWATPLLNVRPYQLSDEAAVYEVCRKTCDDGLDGTDIFPSHPDLVGDRYVGGFVTLMPNYGFVLEDRATGRVVGYALAALDARDFSVKTETAWLPAMQEKYPKPEKQDSLSPAEEMMCSLHDATKVFTSDELLSRFPSLVRVDMLPECRTDPTCFKRLFGAAAMALKTHGSHGVHASLHVGDRNSMESYAMLNFYDVPLTEKPDDVMILGRAI